MMMMSTMMTMMRLTMITMMMMTVMKLSLNEVPTKLRIRSTEFVPTARETKGSDLSKLENVLCSMSPGADYS